MFEGSLVESRGLTVSPAKRWTALGSAMAQCALAALLVAIPLIRPQLPPLHRETPQVMAPLPPKPPVVRVEAAAAASPTTAMSVPATAPMVANTQAVLSRPTGLEMGREMGAEPAITGISMGRGPLNGVLAGMGAGTPTPNVAAAPHRTMGPVNISSGVVTGMLLAPIRPVYPAIARVAGIQGAVVMEATISKTGRIESLRAVSGPPMLRQAALDAVQAARYQPYQLNGQATEVQTTITVVFRLGE
jgi:protein TonB